MKALAFSKGWSPLVAPEGNHPLPALLTFPSYIRNRIPPRNITPPYDPRLDEQFFAHFQSIFTIFFVHTIYPWEFPYRDFQKLAIFYHQWHAGKSQFVDFLCFLGHFHWFWHKNLVFLTSFCYMWNTLEKVFISKMKNVWFWLENELKWDQWFKNYSYFFVSLSKKWSQGLRVNVKICSSRE